MSYGCALINPSRTRYEPVIGRERASKIYCPINRYQVYSTKDRKEEQQKQEEEQE